MSNKWSLIKEDFKKIGIGLLIAIGGAIIAILGDVSKLIDYSQFGVYAPYVALAVGSIASVLINAIRKWTSVTEY